VSGSEVPAVADPEFLHAPVQMRLDGADRDHEAVGDLGVTEVIGAAVSTLPVVKKGYVAMLTFVGRNGAITVDSRIG
jgi:hypothetical protein